MNNDLISREALKKRLQDRHDFWVNAWGGFSDMPLNDKSRVDELSSCIAEVVNAPTVELFCSYLSDGEVRQPCVEGPCEDERPQGEWRRDVVGLYCSICQGRAFVTGTNYCPFCGADMRKGGAE